MPEDVFEYKGYEIPVNLVQKTGAGPETFETISEWHINALKAHIGIRPTDHIVEIGCGIGRDAIPLTSIIDHLGSYLGTDVIRDSVDWCKQNITPKHHNFTFEWHNIKDNLHNPSGTLTAEDVRIGREDNSVDLIILQSVFTHMFENEIIHYLKEFRRILKPSGAVWASVFIVDEQVLSHVNVHAPTTYQLSFKHEFGDGCYINNTEEPRGAVAFTKDAVDRMLRTSETLLAREPLRGSWSGIVAEPEFGQDALIIKRR